MAGPLSRWILARVVKSALAFESDSIETYRRLQDAAGAGGSCGRRLADSLCHLLDEEHRHWQILTDAAAGRLDAEELERLLADHMYSSLAEIEPLEGEDLARWGPELSRALDGEEKTWIFYTNLRRMSTIPAVRRAFHVLGHMEKEHIDILRALLGRSAPALGSTGAPGRAPSP
jgi:rubrerythrin